MFPCPSVFIRGWHTSFHAPRRFRHIPDTYPIHSRHIPDTYVYPMNTPRIPREYPTNPPTVGKKERQNMFNLSSLAIYPRNSSCFIPNSHPKSSIFENVCVIKNAFFCYFSLRVWKKSSTFADVFAEIQIISIKNTQ